VLVHPCHWDSSLAPKLGRVGGRITRRWSAANGPARRARALRLPFPRCSVERELPRAAAKFVEQRHVVRELRECCAERLGRPGSYVRPMRSSSTKAAIPGALGTTTANGHQVLEELVREHQRVVPGTGRLITSPTWNPCIAHPVRPTRSSRRCRDSTSAGDQPTCHRNDALVFPNKLFE